MRSTLTQDAAATARMMRRDASQPTNAFHIASATSVIKSPGQALEGMDSVGSLDWRQWDESTCERRLQADPMDNAARFRLSQIYVYDKKSYRDAEKYLKSILLSKNFMRAETYEMLGDISFFLAQKIKDVPGKGEETNAIDQKKRQDLYKNA